MQILPAIDLYEGKAVRLLHGDYNKMTVYDTDPAAVAQRMYRAGARMLHLVDLAGARDGGTPNLDTVERILKACPVKAELGGGIRDRATVERYLSLGVSRVILGTAAVRDRAFLADMLREYGDRIAVGADLADGVVMIRGWTESANLTCDAFCTELQALGCTTLICTDISRDGAMRGTNLALYRTLCERYHMHIIASGGVTTAGELTALRSAGVAGAILGRAYYEGLLSVEDAIAACGEENR